MLAIVYNQIITTKGIAMSEIPKNEGIDLQKFFELRSYKSIKIHDLEYLVAKLGRAGNENKSHSDTTMINLRVIQQKLFYASNWVDNFLMFHFGLKDDQGKLFNEDFEFTKKLRVHEESLIREIHEESLLKLEFSDFLKTANELKNTFMSLARENSIAIGRTVAGLTEASWLFDLTHGMIMSHKPESQPDSEELKI